MGTRGFITFVTDKTEKTAYNHFDSYPAGLGMEVLTWLRHADLAKAAEDARALRVVRDGERPTVEDAERLAEFTDLSVSSRSTDDWYCLLRGTQGQPGAMLRAGMIEDASDFPAESLSAEWGYVVDFDAQTFEIYEGFQKVAHDKGRFAEREGSDGYYPCALIASWPLSALPTDDEFMKVEGE